MSAHQDDMAEPRKRLYNIFVESGLPAKQITIDAIMQLITAERKRWEQQAAWTPPVDLNDPRYTLRLTTDPIEKFNLFIKKWCPDYAHLIDSDQNDGQVIRNMIAELQPRPDVAEGEK